MTRCPRKTDPADFPSPRARATAYAVSFAALVPIATVLLTLTLHH
ncbi:hypothetical protein [Kitasatospora azatica]|nr:hypothetical protein [Kitasatospora azatica]